MRARFMLAACAAIVFGGLAAAQGGAKHLNPMIELLSRASRCSASTRPAIRAATRARRRSAPRDRSTSWRRRRSTYDKSDFVFNGSMEGGVDRGIAGVHRVRERRWPTRRAGQTPFRAAQHPLIVKTPKIAPDPAKARRQHQPRAEPRRQRHHVRRASRAPTKCKQPASPRCASSRRAARGPTTSASAPAYWGMTRAAVQATRPTCGRSIPNGELVNWTIVESKEGLAHVREIAAVKGIGVLWPGAGTLRGVFSTTNADGERVFDAGGLGERDPAGARGVQGIQRAVRLSRRPPADIEMRMKQGFSVFVMNWGEPGFKAIDLGRARRRA